MGPVLTVSDETYERLSQLGMGLFTEAEVLDRLLSKATHTKPERPITPRNPVASADARPYAVVHSASSQGLPGRVPRQRGVSIAVGEQRIVADSVSDLYEQVLRHLVDTGAMASLMPHIPFKTSSKRVLVSQTPTHPAGHDFVVPVKYGGFYMEAHKSYQTAISALRKFLARGNITMSYPA